MVFFVVVLLLSNWRWQPVCQAVLDHNMVRVAIIGAGIVGLTSAVNVQKLIPDAKVTIISDKFNKDTTSAGAGGLYRPTTHLVKGVPPETVK